MPKLLLVDMQFVLTAVTSLLNPTSSLAANHNSTNKPHLISSVEHGRSGSVSAMDKSAFRLGSEFHQVAAFIGEDLCVGFIVCKQLHPHAMCMHTLSDRQTHTHTHTQHTHTHTHTHTYTHKDIQRQTQTGWERERGGGEGDRQRNRRRNACFICGMAHKDIQRQTQTGWEREREGGGERGKETEGGMHVWYVKVLGCWLYFDKELALQTCS